MNTLSHTRAHMATTAAAEFSNHTPLFAPVPHIANIPQRHLTAGIESDPFKMLTLQIFQSKGRANTVSLSDLRSV